MNTKKKILMALALVGCAILLVVGSVAVTMAYLTSETGTITNTFTVGNVAITMDEAKVDENGKAMSDGSRVDGSTTPANTYKLIPGHTYVKDPTIRVAAGSEDCWLFVKVTNGIAGIEDSSNTIAAQMADKGWTLVAGQTDIYAYKETASEGENILVFETFTIDGSKDVSTYATATNADAKIDVIAYAIQADGFQTAADAWAAAPSTFTNP